MVESNSTSGRPSSVGRSGRLEIQALTKAIGAEIHGIDLSHRLDEGLVAEVRQALLDHGVIFFRDQNLTPGQFLAFAERFGEADEYPMVRGIEGFPRIIEVKKLPHERVNFGGIWHADTTYLPRPPMGTLLLARELPPTGGDTLFASQTLAYETLSAGMKRLLAGLVAVNVSSKAMTSATRADRVGEDAPKTQARHYESAHPAVRTHPETGRKALYVNVAHTLRFKDLTEVESATILNYLFQHQVSPEFTCRFVWRPGSLAFWDNRCTQHHPLNDYHGFKRLLHRITLKGDLPY